MVCKILSDNINFKHLFIKKFDTSRFKTSTYNKAILKPVYI